MPELETDATGATRPRNPVLTWIAAISIVVLAFGLLGECAYVIVLDKPDEARWEKARSDMSQIQPALSEYALDHKGRYPLDLADLVPAYLESVPVDPFTKRQYDYELTKDGFTLTCLGKDQSAGGDQKPNKDIAFDQTGER